MTNITTDTKTIIDDAAADRILADIDALDETTLANIRAVHRNVVDLSVMDALNIKSTWMSLDEDEDSPIVEVVCPVDDVDQAVATLRAALIEKLTPARESFVSPRTTGSCILMFDWLDVRTDGDRQLVRWGATLF